MAATATRTRTGRTPARPKLTAEEATHFDRISASSLIQLTGAVDARKAEGVYPNCPCEPYADFFTFNRWKAQGYAPRKGEKGLRIQTFAPTGDRGDLQESADIPGSDPPEGASVRLRLRPCITHLFCRCQVDLLAAKAVG